MSVETPNFTRQQVCALVLSSLTGEALSEVEYMMTIDADEQENPLYDAWEAMIERLDKYTSCEENFVGRAAMVRQYNIVLLNLNLLVDHDSSPVWNSGTGRFSKPKPHCRLNKKDYDLKHTFHDLEGMFPEGQTLQLP